ncbi:MAG: DUF4253 domain-containing protein, partial [Planctomycetes bacterium]|nr:DUF4253 domain-containing protein [Planctomycetota bacterium]
DAMPQGETLDPRDLKETGLSLEVAQVLREECGEPAVFEGARRKTGLAVLPDVGAAAATLKRLRERLAGKAVAFTPDDNIAAGVPASIVVIDARESLDALAFMGTRNADTIASRIRTWRASTPVEIAGCGDDWVELWFPAPIKDEAIYREAAAWSPAAAAESGGVEGMKGRVDREGLMYLWWEVESKLIPRR